MPVLQAYPVAPSFYTAENLCCSCEGRLIDRKGRWGLSNKGVHL
jgi:hypothetical protein